MSMTSVQLTADELDYVRRRIDDALRNRLAAQRVCRESFGREPNASSINREALLRRLLEKLDTASTSGCAPVLRDYSIYEARVSRLVAVWAGSDPQDAITRFKLGNPRYERAELSAE